MNRTLQLLTLAVLPLFTAAVSAQTVSSDIRVSRPGAGGGSFYVGGAAGLASYDDTDDSDVGFSLFGGYAFTEVLAAELGFQDYGEAEGDGASLEVSAIYLSLVATASLRSDAGLFGKLGILEWDSDSRVANASSSDSGSEAFVGFGGNYAIGARSLLRFEIDFIPVEDEDIVFYNVGFVQRF